jgi:hypothetical protein
MSGRMLLLLLFVVLSTLPQQYADTSMHRDATDEHKGDDAAMKPAIDGLQVE